MPRLSIKKISKNKNQMVTKSDTLSPREDNPKPRYYDDKYWSINSMGRLNKGIDYYFYSK